MKKVILILIFILLAAAIYTGWHIAGPAIKAPEGKYLYIPTGSTFKAVKDSLQKNGIISNGFFFDQLAKRAKYSVVKPGRYEIENGSNLIALVKMLKRGNQAPVKLVINKLRTKEDLAARIGKNFEADSSEAISFLSSNDSLRRFKLDTNTVMTVVIPNTYLITWNGDFRKIFSRLNSEKEKFWNEKRRQQAAAKNLSPEQIYTMASIVEEETNKKEDKGLIASVYINRIEKGMKLEADPTVKYAMRNFGLKRILYGHLQYESPYNTYRNTGLPPGPICTPSPATIDEVLNAPDTDYIFFVAKPDFRGYSNFAVTYAEHLQFARAYQKALDSLIISKNKK